MSAGSKDRRVASEGDVYPVSAERFADTYEEVRSNVYQKTSPVWAQVADRAGKVKTKEGGQASCSKGDRCVYSDAERTDVSVMKASDLASLCEAFD